MIETEGRTEADMGIPDLVRELGTRYGSLSRASRKADIPIGTLHDLQTGVVKNPRMQTLQRIVEALDLPPEKSAAVWVALMARDDAHDAEPSLTR